MPLNIFNIHKRRGQRWESRKRDPIQFSWHYDTEQPVPSTWNAIVRRFRRRRVPRVIKKKYSISIPICQKTKKDSAYPRKFDSKNTVNRRRQEGWLKTYQIYHAKIPSSKRTKPRKRFKAPLIARFVATADLEENPPSFLMIVFSFALNVVPETKT